MSATARGRGLDEQTFGLLLAEVETPLRRALVARFGVEIGNDACRDALAYGWEHRATLTDHENLAGYLFRVGQSSARRYFRWRRRPDLPPEQPPAEQPVEPGLGAALRKLSANQRVAVVLVHGYHYSYEEAAEILDVPITALRNHVHRGLVRLRLLLEA